MKHYYENILLHHKVRLGPYALTEKSITEFGAMWDPLPLHIDPDFAAETANGRVIASGFHLLAICQKMFIEQNPPLAIVVGLGIDEVRFLNPGLPGDQLFLEIEVVAKRESRSNPAVGIVTHSSQLLDQDGKAILSYKGTGMIEKREKSGECVIRPVVSS